MSQLPCWNRLLLPPRTDVTCYAGGCDPGWTSAPRRHQPVVTLCQQVPATLAHDALLEERERYPKAQISAALREASLMSLYNSVPSIYGHETGPICSHDSSGTLYSRPLVHRQLARPLEKLLFYLKALVSHYGMWVSCLTLARTASVNNPTALSTCRPTQHVPSRDDFSCLTFPFSSLFLFSLHFLHRFLSLVQFIHF